MMARGVTNDRIVFAHPCKARHQLLAAKKLGVTYVALPSPPFLPFMCLACLSFYPPLHCAVCQRMSCAMYDVVRVLSY